MRAPTSTIARSLARRTTRVGGVERRTRPFHEPDPLRIRHPLGFVLAPLVGLANLLIVWRYRIKTRTELAEMPEHRRDDVGLDRETIDRETRKAFWMR